MPTLLLSLLFASPASAQVAITGQPGTYSSITEAIAAASPGDEITVVALTVLDEGVTLPFDLTLRGPSVTWSNSAGVAPILTVAPGVSVEVSGFELAAANRLGVQAQAGATVVLDGIGASGFTGVDGGVVRGTDADLVVRNSVFTGGSAMDGGAIWLSGGSLVIEGSLFSDNAATDYGGHLFLEGVGSVQITGSDFVRGSASDGGGIHGTASGALMTLDGVRFEANDATAGLQGSGRGGAIWADGYSVSALDSSWTGNTADQHAVGRISGMQGQSMDVADSGFDGNETRLAEGNLRTIGLDVSMRDSAWTGNSNGAEPGWALPGWYATGDYASAVFERNEFGGYGRVLYLNPDFPWTETIEIRDNRFVGLVASPSGGGGIGQVFGGAVVIEGNVFRENQGNLTVHANGTLDVRYNDFCENGGSSGGGALHLTGDAMHRVYNNRFVRNSSALGGGALYLNTTFFSVSNNAWLENDAPLGSAIYAPELDTFVSALNGIFAWNTGGPAIQAVQAYSPYVDYGMWYQNSGGDLGGSLAGTDLTASGNNLFVEPLFEDWAPGMACDQYSLVPIAGAPQIDVGSQFDLDGTRADIGPYGGQNADPDWFADADQDGVTGLYDCDDGDATVFPGADEWCDGVDNDCAGDVDEADALDAVDWFGDGDGDGYGAGSPLEHGCAPTVDAVDRSGDCDDMDGSIHPGAVEIAGDGIDQDCNGSDVAGGTGSGTGAGTGAATGTGTGGTSTGAPTGGTATGIVGDTGGDVDHKGCSTAPGAAGSFGLILLLTLLRGRSLHLHPSD